MVYGVDSGFDINEQPFIADALAAETRATLPSTASAIKLRLITPDPKLVRPAPSAGNEHHAAISTSSQPAPFAKPAVLQTPVVPKTTLSEIPLPSCAISKTPVEVTIAVADATADALKTSPVTQANVIALPINSVLFSASGTQRKIIEKTGDSIIFEVTKRFENGTLGNQFHTGDDTPLTLENFQDVKIKDRFYPVGGRGPEFYVAAIHKTDDRVSGVTMTYFHVEPQDQDFSYVTRISKPFTKHIKGNAPVRAGDEGATDKYKILTAKK